MYDLFYIRGELLLRWLLDGISVALDCDCIIINAPATAAV